MQFFFQELYSHIDKNSGRKFEEIFLVKIASKGTSLSSNMTVLDHGKDFKVQREKFAALRLREGHGPRRCIRNRFKAYQTNFLTKSVWFLQLLLLHFYKYF